VGLLVALLGRVDYEEALKLQEKLLRLRQQNEIDDSLILLEHPSVLTIGRSGSYANLLVSEHVLQSYGVSIHEVNRGGDITYHGPGQIVGYPILNLNNHGKDMKKLVWMIEEIFIQLLGEIYGLRTSREIQYRGVWVGDKKIVAVGVGIKRWVTMHGFAFNVNTQLEHFKWINPCGIPDKGVTSLRELLGKEVNLDRVFMYIVTYWCRVFGMRYEIISTTDLYNLAKGEQV
jgi:lipoyl(octanoyl) transferase